MPELQNTDNNDPFIRTKFSYQTVKQYVSNSWFGYFAFQTMEPQWFVHVILSAEG